MTNFIVEILASIVLGLLYFIASPVLLFVGKFVLKVITLNKYPPKKPNDKQIQNSIDAGFIFFLIIIIMIFFIRNN
jgi:hypothetical protein